MFAFGVFEIFQQLFLRGGEFSWCIYDYCHNVGAAAAAFDMGHAVTGEFKIAAALGTGWYFHADWAVYCFDVYFRTQGRVHHADVFGR